jgi:tryptophanyl-tRNA synthetase
MFFDTTEPPQKPVVVMSGMRPTGRLHLGHYVGVLQNWLTLQTQFPCYFMIADWHALTTQYDTPQKISENTLNLAIDWLACGIDPNQATIYVQSWVPDIIELAMILAMLTPVKWLETDPTLKDMVAMTRQVQDDGTEKTELNLGLLSYPVLQTADILSVGGTHVPVGKDQLAHLEISRDIARRVNHLYRRELFAEPLPLLAETPLLSGLDGRKMGKSLNNAIQLSDDADVVVQKIKREAITDRGRIKRQDAGNPSNCEVVYSYYRVFSPQALASVDAECRTAARGCLDCKLQLAEALNALLEPIRTRRKLFESDKAQVLAILKSGSEKARDEAAPIIRQLKAAMGWTTLS